MDDYEAAIAERIYAAVQRAATDTSRGQQAAEFRVGISDLGTCAEATRRMIANIPEAEEKDALAAFYGTVIGDAVEKQAIPLVWPDAVIQSDVSVTLHGYDRDYTIPGHVDVILPSEGLVLDGKTTRGLSTVERAGADRQQRWQRHNYGLGAWNAGHFGTLPLEEVRVGNFWFDRAADDNYCHVEIERYDPAQTMESALWLDQVVQSYLAGEEALKEPPRQWCEVACGHFETCRVSDVAGLIEDPIIAVAAELYAEGAEMVREGTRLKDQQKAILTGIAGRTRAHSIRTIHVNGSESHVVRKPHDRLDIKVLK